MKRVLTLQRKQSHHLTLNAIIAQINHEIIEYTSQDIEYTKLCFGQKPAEL